MSDFLANAEDQIAGGTTFEEFAKDASLPIKATPLIVSGGVSPQKPDYQPAPEISALLKPAFDMELDDDPQMVTVAPIRLMRCWMSQMSKLRLRLHWKGCMTGLFSSFRSIVQRQKRNPSPRKSLRRSTRAQTCQRR